MMHGNFSQGILGAILGLFLGKIDVRHNSLMPSILVHMGINISASIFSIFGQFAGSPAMFILNIGYSMLYLAMVVTGVVFWVIKERKELLPYPMPKQAVRQRIFWSSPVMLMTFAFLIMQILLFGM